MKLKIEGESPSERVAVLKLVPSRDISGAVDLITYFEDGPSEAVLFTLTNGGLIYSRKSTGLLFSRRDGFPVLRYSFSNYTDRRREG